MLDYLASTTERSGDYRADIVRRAHALRYGRDEAERRIEAGIRFDDSFPEFVRACIAAAVELVVLTSGVQELVERYLARREVTLPVVGNAAEFRGDGWRIRFRDESPAGIDKCAFVERARNEGRTAIVIGDDRSDFEAALAADVTYAKSGSELERFLRLQLRACRSFDRFDDILERWPPSDW